MTTKKPALAIKPVKSSNVAGYHYDAGTNTLSIQFKTGKTYPYVGVQQKDVDALLAAPSFGSHVSKHIIPKFKVAGAR